MAGGGLLEADDDLGDGVLVANSVGFVAAEFVKALSLRSRSSRLIGGGAFGSTRFDFGGVNIGLGLTVGSNGGGETGAFRYSNTSDRGATVSCVAVSLSSWVGFAIRLSLLWKRLTCLVSRRTLFMKPLPVRVLVRPNPKFRVEGGGLGFAFFLGVRINFIFPIFGKGGTSDGETCLI